MVVVIAYNTVCDSVTHDFVRKAKPRKCLQFAIIAFAAMLSFVGLTNAALEVRGLIFWPERMILSSFRSVS